MDTGNVIWQRWLERFWFLRGVAAAVALAALVPEITDLSRWEFLRAFEWLVTNWNAWAKEIGALIGNLPWMPRLSARAVNALMLCLCLFLPSAIGTFVGSKDYTVGFSNLSLWGKLTGLFMALVGAFMVSQAIGELTGLSPANIWQSADGWRLVTKTALGLAFCAVIPRLFFPELLWIRLFWGTVGTLLAIYITVSLITL